ncbi:uncharacterized protein LOC122084322 [Macadamia integrifolia]|uniref:uncharacterized protein LOC122084322 n=1 Tax=Macadamia integrifolia TaxID=60698 RepID=UPI001C4F6E68|nr:uncharacterized protein LOC122084322 [Macadamia integrifolia]
MDWVSWLSKTELHPSLVHKYSLAFAHNELEEEDIAYFDHEFLQSIGITIAKHRLEILKLAKKEKVGKPPPVSRVIAAIKKTKRCLSNYIHTLVHGDESALIVFQKANNSKRWREAMLKRNKRLMMLKQGRSLMVSNGSPKVAGPPNGCGGSPVASQLHNNNEKVADDGDAYWSTAVEEFKWDSMFQDLKPT